MAVWQRALGDVRLRLSGRLILATGGVCAITAHSWCFGFIIGNTTQQHTLRTDLQMDQITCHCSSPPQRGREEGTKTLKHDCEGMHNHLSKILKSPGFMHLQNHRGKI